MNPTDKPLAWLGGEITTPPMTRGARIEAGHLLRLLQSGVSLGMPHSRPMPTVGPRCHELRVVDEDTSWRIVYRTDHDAIVILDIFRKTTGKTPRSVIERCRQRMRRYDSDSRQGA